MSAPHVTLFGDPACPFTFETARWLEVVERHRDVRVDVRAMSLAVLHEGTATADLPAWDRNVVAHGRPPLRVLAAAADRHGSERVRPLWMALAARYRAGRTLADTSVLGEALAEAGADADLVGAATVEHWDTEVSASHASGLGPVGADVGSPIVHIATSSGVRAFFGPVVSAAPSDASAVLLWDGLLALASVDEFAEVKRGVGRLAPFASASPTSPPRGAMASSDVACRDRVAGWRGRIAVRFRGPAAGSVRV